MNAQTKIMREIIKRVIDSGDANPRPLDTVDQIEEAWDDVDSVRQDIESEFREGEIETKLQCEFSRNYESKSVAAKMSDGSWVGWTYWFGGGKHGDPGAIPWMDDAYDLDCVEEQKMVTVRTWTKKEVSK